MGPLVRRARYAAPPSAGYFPFYTDIFISGSAPRLVCHADKNAGREFFRPGFYATKRPAVQRGFYKFMDVPDMAYRCNRF